MLVNHNFNSSHNSSKVTDFRMVLERQKSDKTITEIQLLNAEFTEYATKMQILQTTNIASASRNSTKIVFHRSDIGEQTFVSPLKKPL